MPYKCEEGLNYYHLSPKDYFALIGTLVAEGNNNDKYNVFSDKALPQPGK